MVNIDANDTYLFHFPCVMMERTQPHTKLLSPLYNWVNIFTKEDSLHAKSSAFF